MIKTRNFSDMVTLIFCWDDPFVFHSLQILGWPPSIIHSWTCRIPRHFVDVLTHAHFSFRWPRVPRSGTASQILSPNKKRCSRPGATVTGHLCKLALTSTEHKESRSSPLNPRSVWLEVSQNVWMCVLIYIYMEYKGKYCQLWLDVVIHWPLFDRP